MNRSFKIGVIGTINRDIIGRADGTTHHGWGGILYNLVALSNLAGGRAEIIPAGLVGRDCSGPILNILGRLGGVRTDRINVVAQKNNHCFLAYDRQGNKSEILRGGVRPLRFDDVVGLLECDIVLVNFISGRDIDIRSLLKFRFEYAGPIYIDVHSSTLGKRADGRRYLRRPKSWKKIIAAADYVQLNRLELSVLAGGRRDRPVPEMWADMTARSELAPEAIADKIFIVTDGASGGQILLAESGYLQRERIFPGEVIRGGDTTGCGDCFSAGFLWGLLCGRNLVDCCRLGNRAAGERIIDKRGHYSHFLSGRHSY